MILAILQMLVERRCGVNIKGFAWNAVIQYFDDSKRIFRVSHECIFTPEMVDKIIINKRQDAQIVLISKET